MIKTCLINRRQRISYSQVAGPYCGKPVQWPVSSSTEQAADILKNWVALMRNRWPVSNWKLRFVMFSPYFRESNILVSLMEEHGIGGGLGGKRNIQDPNLNPRWLLHVILTPFLFLVCFLQCGEIQGETGQTRKVPWRRRGLVKNDLKKRKLHPWGCYTWFLGQEKKHGSWFWVITLSNSQVFQRLLLHWQFCSRDEGRAWKSAGIIDSDDDRIFILVLTAPKNYPICPR